LGRNSGHEAALCEGAVVGRKAKLELEKAQFRARLSFERERSIRLFPAADQARHGPEKRAPPDRTPLGAHLADARARQPGQGRFLDGPLARLNRSEHYIYQGVL
jgi:hypothetical protein